jgi:2'-5' RNA ligase superfamily protein
VTAEPTPTALTPQSEDWLRFRRLRSLTNHWQRPGWTLGRQAYYWYLTFNSVQLRDMADRCLDRLRLPYLDPVPLDGLHLTLPRVGWADHLPSDAVDSVTEAALRRCSRLDPFTLSVGPLAGSAGAVRFSVDPWDPILALRQQLQNAARAALGSACNEDDYRPHIGIAYCNSPVSPGPLIEAVVPLRSLPPVDVSVNHVDLVLLRREGRAYTWDTIHSLPLGQDREPAVADV